MNTLFEVVLVGEDEENLRAAGEAALDEVVRVEKLLSRFDPTSETSRVNRQGFPGPVIVDHEMIEIVRRCHEFSLRTDGYFDVTAVSRAGEATTEAAIVIDPERRLLRFRRAGLFLDFGGCGKGYALDRAVGVLQDGGVKKALLHGGTSSVRVIGDWTVGVRDPWEPSAEVGRVRLGDEALACSAASHGAETSDIVDPARGERLREQAGCVVIAKGEWSAFEAEMLSTGLLAMGRERAGVCCRREEHRGVRVAWIHLREGRAALEWDPDQLRTDSMPEPWPFEDAENTAVFTSRKILDRTDWIHYVTHDEDDGAWQFHPLGAPTPEGEAAVVSLKSIVDLDDSIRALADLPVGWHAWRDAQGASWTREPIKRDSPNAQR